MFFQLLSETPAPATTQREKFRELYAQHWVDLYRFAVYTLGNREDAEDAVQDAVIKAYKHFDKLQNHDAFKSWMFTIVSNCCKSKLRNIIRDRKFMMEEMFTDFSEQDLTENVVDALDLVAELQQLENDERLIVTLSIVGNYKSRELAGILKIPEGTVRSKLHRALKKLRTKIEEDELNG